MEEQQPYLNLIQQLLNCTSEEELNQTLSDNQNLLNGNLIAILDQVIPLLREQGEEEEAQRCEYLAQRFRQMWGQDEEANLNLGRLEKYKVLQ
jgi:CHASE3 domain sensor protein